ncbi:MAG: Nif3-like dinuclear metal center hexameric protein [Planctomycetes bacterium]|nr:Nif3-like dinuclear metal center hexameric protein [Planctomycetota bacterium]
MPTVGMMIAALNRFAPLELATEWDNVGLLFGDSNAEVQRVLTCLTVTEETAAEAIEGGAQLIVTHHPILFRGTKRLTLSSPEGKQLWPLARAGVAIYSPHTSFDNCTGGINDSLAKRMELTEVQPLRSKTRSQFKIVIFTPDGDLAKVSNALFEAGAGIIGQYRECSYRIAGTGTFFGSDASNPAVGQKGRREEVSEWRLEVVCPENRLESALRAMRAAHSYEEPAYDVYQLRPSASGIGEGRIGRLVNPIPLAEVGSHAKRVLNAEAVQIVGDGTRKIEHIAIACGAAGEFLSDAVRAKADAFLTGEMRFHELLAAKSQGMALILPGHYATERPAIEELAVKLGEEWPGLAIWASRRECDPVTTI